MENTNEEKHSEKELLAIYTEKYGKSEHASYFIDCYNRTFNEVKEDDGFLEEGEIKKEGVLDYALKFYLNKFIPLLKIGHSAKWAHLIASSSEEENVAFYYAYKAIKEEDIDQAKNELLVYCKSIEKVDPIFTNYFIQLFKDGEGYENPTEKAEIYCTTYKKQLEEGRSELFAHQYAENMAYDDFIEVYCYAYAEAFEKAVLEDKTERYAGVYAEMFGDYVGNYYPKFPNVKDYEFFDYDHDKILAHMKAWEYTLEHKLEDNERFIENYKTIYLNTYYADEGLPNLSKEEIDAQILKEALEQVNRK